MNCLKSEEIFQTRVWPIARARARDDFLGGQAALMPAGRYVVANCDHIAESIGGGHCGVS